MKSSSGASRGSREAYRNRLTGLLADGGSDCLRMPECVRMPDCKSKMRSSATLEFDIAAICSSNFKALMYVAVKQGLTLVHVRAQLEQLQDTFMRYVGLCGGWTEELKVS